VVGGDAEGGEDRGGEIAVLAGLHDGCAVAERGDHRGELDRLRAGAEDDEDVGHCG
jgi:hypothetical protein